jgi:peptidoglycan/LPS O-acetylase OafA/YrhL
MGRRANDREESLTPTEQPLPRQRMPELDTVRGLAIIGVLLYHAFCETRDLQAYQPWQRHILSLMSVGQFGVNLFFVLSGFLINGVLLDSRKRPDYNQRFYYRRALRILPALLLHATSVDRFARRHAPHHPWFVWG